MKTIIEMKNIRKEFPGVIALDDISFNLNLGEVHVLIGENGAGKSTLIKILSGIYSPSAGQIIINGKSYNSITPKEAFAEGISVIFQELSVVDNLSIEENLFVGKLPRKKKFGITYVDYETMEKSALDAMNKVGLDMVSPKTLVGRLSISQKQQVEIAKALVANSKVIVMDEPTSSLNNEEVKSLFSIIHNLKKQGVGIIYISHKLRELSQIGDRITIIKDGKTLRTDFVGNISNDEIVSTMVGRELSKKYYNKDKSHKTDKVIFEAKNIVRLDKKVNDVSFKLYVGEILGFSGLVGAGRTELMNVLFGAEKMSSGEVYYDGKKLNTVSPYRSLKNGLGMITEDRRDTGFMPNFKIWQNIALPSRLKRSSAKGLLGLINKKTEIPNAEKYGKEINIKCTSVNQMITQLSGGNQQKVIIAKWLAAQSNILFFDEPTRGIDVGAKDEIYKIMRDLANQGKSVIMVSSELPELLSVCDRILVMGEGKILGSFTAEEATEEKVMKVATKGVTENE
ncbi:MAG: sugar ABC transporter ATP-binding protein [Pleomorphochaeta sp.]